MELRLMFLVFGLFFTLLSGCKGGADPQKKNGHGEQQSSASAPQKDPGMVGVVRKTGFGSNKSLPIGKALDDYRYFTKRSWQETSLKNGTIYVDFNGELDPLAFAATARKDRLVASSLNVKFVVKTNGDCFVGLITLYDTKNDGKSSPVQFTDIAGVMNALYANKELPQP